MQPDYRGRVEKLRERMSGAGIDVMLVSEPNNVFYLCGSNGGYTGARVRLIVDRHTSTLLIDKRYLEETLVSATADTIAPWTLPSLAEVVNVVKGIGGGRVGFESNHVTVKQYERLQKEFEGLEPVGVYGLIEPIREKKDEFEIERISEAAKIADKTFSHIIEFIKPGAVEMDIGIEIDHYMRMLGAEKSSFDTIVASGIHSSVPHATLTRKEFEAGDFVTLDFGAVVDGYCSDMTRTVVVGKASDKQKEIYNKVLEAQQAALDAVGPEKVCQDLDGIARGIITEAGYGDFFVHGLGHGVGLQIHETPTLAKGVETILRPDMVVTVEPGIYVPGFGGVRIEDLVVITETGRGVLSHSTKDLLEL